MLARSMYTEECVRALHERTRIDSKKGKDSSSGVFVSRTHENASFSAIRYNEVIKAKERGMVLGLDEIKKRITPIAKKYSLRAVYLFGSYARGEANQSSDIDLLIDSTGSTIKGLFDMGGLYNDLCEACGKSVDVVTTNTLNQPITKSRLPYFAENLQRDKIQIYG